MTHAKLSLLLLPFLASCSLIGTSTPTDFTSLYQAHVSEQMSSFREVAKDLGYMESYMSDGTIRLMADIPMILSGAISTSYEAKVHGQDADIRFLSPTGGYETILASGSLMAKEIAMISKAGDAFFRYEGLETLGLIEADMEALLTKYSGKWLSIREEDLTESLSGSSEEDIMAEKLSQAITKLTLSGIEGYLKKYPIWKEKKSLGMSGGLSTFEVELAKEQIVAFVEDFAREALGKDLDTDAKKELQDTLASISLDGIMAFDPKDAKRVVFDGTLKSEEGESIKIALDTGSDATTLSIAGGDTMTTLAWKKISDEYTMNMTATQSGTTALSIVGTVQKEGDEVRKIDMTLDAPSQGVSVKLDHSSDGKGNFEGKLNAGIGNITWKGKLEISGLAELHISGAMIGSSLALDLTPGTGGLLRGPLTLKSGDTLVASAEVGLRVSREAFGLILDITSPEDPSMKSHAEIEVTGKREPWTGKIEAPADTESFEEFANALGALNPPDDVFTEDTSLEESSLDDMSLSGYIVQ